MDILSDILSHLNLKTSVYFRSDLKTPWGVKVPSYKNVARFHIALKGSFWLATEEGKNIQIHPGDVILVPHGKRHILKDALKSKVKTLHDVIKQGEYKAGELLKLGDGSGKTTQLLCGHFEFESYHSHPLLQSLPDYIHVKSKKDNDLAWLNTALSFIDSESLHREPGASSIINKLSEVLFIQVLRYYIKNNIKNTLFLTALNDKQIRRSIEEIHKKPGYKWRVEELAKVSGLSRTVYSERFSKLTGMTPMNYIAQWRMEKAKQILKDKTISINTVAEQVGYSANEAFQKTFKKIVGTTPSAYRKNNLR